MDVVISPAKKLDFNRGQGFDLTKPDFLTKTNLLIKDLERMSVKDIKILMKLSDNLAKLNEARYKTFNETTDIAPAAFAFIGDTYQGLNIEEFSKADIKYAQDHLFILSGLYGLLRPLDEIKPYRLEMGTRLKTDYGKNLYEFWGDQITKRLNTYKKKSKYLINLASEEYSKSIKLDGLDHEFVNVKFLENKNGVYKSIGLMSKRARGAMASYVIKNKIKDLEELKKFDLDGYIFDEKESCENLLVFKR